MTDAPVNVRQVGFGRVHDEALISCARKGLLKEGYLEPRLWEKLRRQLQAEYRRATGEPHATLVVELGE